MRDLSLLYGPVRRWSAILGTVLAAVLIAVVARSSVESASACVGEGETLAVAEQAYDSACQNLATDCGIAGGRWVCGDRPVGVESPARRSSSPAAQNPDLVFAAGGTAVWTAVANREANSEQARPDGLAATPRALVVAADTLQSDSPRSGSDGDQRPASAAAVRAGCIGEGRTLLQAEQAYDESCSDPPGGCRTEDLGWICSSEEPEDPQPRP